MTEIWHVTSKWTQKPLPFYYHTHLHILDDWPFVFGALTQQVTIIGHFTNHNTFSCISLEITHYHTTLTPPAWYFLRADLFSSPQHSHQTNYMEYKKALNLSNRLYSSQMQIFH